MTTEFQQTLGIGKSVRGSTEVSYQNFRKVLAGFHSVVLAKIKALEPPEAVSSHFYVNNGKGWEEVSKYQELRDILNKRGNNNH